MKDRPILFTSDNAQKVYLRQKTQTRRAAWPQPPEDGRAKLWTYDPGGNPRLALGWMTDDNLTGASIFRYGVPGDRLWVREEFQIVQPHGSVDEEWIGDDFIEVDGPLPHEKPEALGNWWSIVYRGAGDIGVTWRSPIFMTRWASRSLITIDDIRLERLRDISDVDIAAELGITEPLPGPWPGPYHNYLINRFRESWDSINARPKPIFDKGRITHYVSCPWEGSYLEATYRSLPWYQYRNPWVWAISWHEVDCV